VTKNSKSCKGSFIWGAAVVSSWLAVGVVPLFAASLALSAGRPLADWDYDGNRILGHVGHDVYVWDAHSGQVLRKFVGHKERIDFVRFSPDGQRVVSSSWINGGELCRMHLPQFHSKDTSVRLWSLKNGKEIWKLEGQVFGQISSDGKRLLTYSRLHLPDPDCDPSRGVVMWDVPTGRKLFSIDPNWACAALAFNPDDRRFLCLSGQTAVLFDAENGREIREIPRVISFSFYGQGGDLAVLTLDAFEIWDSITGQRTHRLPDSSRVPWDGVTWNENGVQAIKLGSSKESACHITLWDIASGSVAGRFPCPPDAIYFQSVLISPNMDRILIAWGDATVENNRYIPPEFGLFNLNDGKELTRAMSPGETVLGFSPDAKTLLIGGRTFLVYSANSGEPLVKLDLLGRNCPEEPTCNLTTRRPPDY
jgi:WD40 repeat protein